MKVWSTFVSAAVLTGTCTAALFGSKPDLDVKGSFGDLNPFSHVTNGKSNKLFITVTNHAKHDIAITSVSGSFSERTSGGREKLLRNTTTIKYDVKLTPAETRILTYAFHSEFKPRELLFSAFVDFVDPASPKEKHREVAYEGQVTVLEQKGSWFDPALLFAYIVMLGLVGGAAYLGYNLYFGNTKGKARKRPITSSYSAVSTKEETPETIAAAKEEWIPSHHKAKKGGSALSGDETSGTEGYSSAGGVRRSNRRKAR